MNTKRWRVPMPDKDWLAGEYLLPPKGKGRSCPNIGRDLGVSKHAVQRWVKKLGLWESSKPRRVFMRKGHATHFLQHPDKYDLAAKYLLPPDGLGMSLQQLSEAYVVSVPTIRKWLKACLLHQQFSDRHSDRMSGDGNPAWVGGTSRRYQVNLLEAKHKVCEWCGSKDETQIHHRDHDRENCDLANLTWLCGPCNRMESQFHALMSRGRAEIVVNENAHEITIKFLNMEA